MRPPHRPRLNGSTSPLALFTYLRSTYGHIHTSTIAPPVYSKTLAISPTSSSSSPIRNTTLEGIPEDEEAGFWHAQPPQYDDREEEQEGEDCCWGFADGFALAMYVGMVVIMALNLDLFLLRWDVDTRIFPIGTVSQQGTEMVFCRTYQGTGQGTYHLLSPDAKACQGESITLFISSSTTAFSISDGVLFGTSPQDTITEKEINSEKGSKFLQEGKIDASEVEGLGDDLAQEGKLSHSSTWPPTVPLQGNSMHAGFGGPWRVRM